MFQALSMRSLIEAMQVGGWKARGHRRAPLPLPTHTNGPTPRTAPTDTPQRAAPIRNRLPRRPGMSSLYRLANWHGTWHQLVESDLIQPGWGDAQGHSAVEADGALLLLHLHRVDEGLTKARHRQFAEVYKTGCTLYPDYILTNGWNVEQALVGMQRKL